MTPATPEEHVGHDMLFGKIPGVARPDGIVFIVDADNLERNLFLLSQVREFDFPVIVALNMIDVAARHGIQIDTERLSVELGCPVVSIIAKTGTGLDTLKVAIKSLTTALARAAAVVRSNSVLITQRRSPIAARSTPPSPRRDAPKPSTAS
jgi:ferrous iron transport protein B